MYKITPVIRLQLKWLKYLDTQLNKPTNQNLLKSPKLLSQRIRKMYYKTLGNNQPIVPSLIDVQGGVMGRLPPPPNDFGGAVGTPKFFFHFTPPI